MSSSRGQVVGVAALRAVLRLVGDLKDLPDGSEAQRRLALEGLSRILGAKVGLWMEAKVEDGEVRLACPIDMGWSTASERAAFCYYLDAQRAYPDPAVPRLAAVLATPEATVLRSEVITDREWYGSEHVQDIRRAAGVDGFVQSMRVLPDGRITSIGLHRPWNDRPFSDEDRAILHAFRAETPWLDAPREHASPADGLSPRLADVLALLLGGASEKEVAAALGLSPHTTHGYVKVLYRRFGVRSRGELLARALTGADVARPRLASSLARPPARRR